MDAIIQDYRFSPDSICSTQYQDSLKDGIIAPDAELLPIQLPEHEYQGRVNISEWMIDSVWA